jgi:hypothetical protein
MRIHACNPTHHSIEHDPPEYLSVTNPNQLRFVVIRGGVPGERKRATFSPRRTDYGRGREYEEWSDLPALVLNPPDPSNDDLEAFANTRGQE